METGIESTTYTREDFQSFAARLKEETELYKQWRGQNGFVDEPARIRLGLDAWLVDADGRLAPRNEAVLGQPASALPARGLLRHSLHLDMPDVALAGRPFTAMEADLQRLAHDIDAAAHGARLMMCGIPPSLGVDDLTQDRLSQPLGEQSLAARVLLACNPRSLALDIDGEEPLQLTSEDRLLAAATASMSLQLQVSAADAAPAYNASLLASGATVAIAANSPFLFGRRLWEETRIGLCEQAIAPIPASGGHAGAYPRVNFGNGYGRDVLYGLFIENRQHFPVLLPLRSTEPRERLPHLRLHNDTIWRWNRPAIDFGDDGRPRLAVQHRVMAPGPTALDSAANAAFYFGLVQGLMTAEQDNPGARPSFAVAEANFYRAARHGLRAEVEGYGAKSLTVRDLLLREWLPLAARGLKQAGVEAADVDRYLGVVEHRVDSGRTGAAWQTDWVSRHGRDFEALVSAYLDNQASGAPVHDWAT